MPSQVELGENFRTVKQELGKSTIEEVEWAVDMLKDGKALGGICNYCRTPERRRKKSNGTTKTTS